jgi:hypothetical protein
MTPTPTTKAPSASRACWSDVTADVIPVIVLARETLGGIRRRVCDGPRNGQPLGYVGVGDDLRSEQMVVTIKMHVLDS